MVAAQSGAIGVILIVDLVILFVGDLLCDILGKDFRQVFSVAFTGWRIDFYLVFWCTRENVCVLASLLFLVSS